MNIVKNPELRKNKTKIEKNNGVNGKNNRYNYNYNKTNITYCWNTSPTDIIN